MLTKGIQKYLINPSLGLLPSLLYVSLFFVYHNLFFALVVSILFAGIVDLIIRYYVKASTSRLLFLVNFCALSITFGFWIILHKTSITNLLYIILYELVFFILLTITRMFRTKISNYLDKKKQDTTQKTYLHDFFETSNHVQHAISYHLFVLLIYRHINGNLDSSNDANTLLYGILPILFIVVIIFYEEMKTLNIVKLLQKEEWLPIVNESGEVTGRIAKSVSVRMKNTLLHPVIRVVLVSDGKLYLQKKAEDDILDPNTYDHPFEKYMLYGHEINTAIRNSIVKSLNKEELSFNYLLKYIYENENSKRLILLYVSHIENEQQLNSLNSLSGKFWTMQEIEESFNDDGVFSECFQLEYEYLKNTIIQPLQ